MLPVAIRNRLGGTRRRILQRSRLSGQRQRDQKEHEAARQHENVVSHRHATTSFDFAQFRLAQDDYVLHNVSTG